MEVLLIDPCLQMRQSETSLEVAQPAAEQELHYVLQGKFDLAEEQHGKQSPVLERQESMKAVGLEGGAPAMEDVEAANMYSEEYRAPCYSQAAKREECV